MNGGVIHIPGEDENRNPYKTLDAFLRDRYSNSNSFKRYDITYLPSVLMFTLAAKLRIDGVDSGTGATNTTWVNQEIVFPEEFELRCGNEVHKYRINGYVYCQSQKGDHFIPCIRTKEGWYIIDDMRKDKQPMKVMDKYKPDYQYRDGNNNVVKHICKELALYERVSITTIK